MGPVLVFFAVAVVAGVLIRGFVALRLRAATRQPDVTDAEVCQLQQANRISSAALVASLVGLAVVGVILLVG